MNTTALQNRLTQLTLQDASGYRQRESQEAIEQLKQQLSEQLKAMDAEIELLDKEYRVLVADRAADQTHRMEVYNRKLSLAGEAEAIRVNIHDQNQLLKRSRRIYADSEELQASLREQYQIRLALWGRPEHPKPDLTLIHCGDGA